MTFLRGAEAETVVAHRFRVEMDTFASWREGDLWVSRTDVPAEGSVSLFHALSAEMPGTVSVSFLRVRDGEAWEGGNVALSDVRESIARLRSPLSRTGSVIVTLWGDGRQLSLSAQLSVWCWARTPVWREVLVASGLGQVSVSALGDRRWASAHNALAGSQELDRAIEAAVSRLGLGAPSRTRHD